jgi:hypothetical protein
MGKISKPKRQRQGSKRLDLSNLKALIKDRRCWVCSAVVVKPEGEQTHFEIVTDGGEVAVYVDVETVPQRLDLTCKLGGDGSVYRIPNVGDEVAVVIPEGEMDGLDPVIVAVFPSGMPDGVAENVTVIANSQVLIHDGAGGAEPLPTMAEFRGHTHPSGTGPTSATIDPIPAVGPITGTEVLRTK